MVLININVNFLAETGTFLIILVFYEYSNFKIEICCKILYKSLE